MIFFILVLLISSRPFLFTCTCKTVVTPNTTCLKKGLHNRITSHSSLKAVDLKILETIFKINNNKACIRV